MTFGHPVHLTREPWPRTQRAVADAAAEVTAGPLDLATMREAEKQTGTLSLPRPDLGPKPEKEQPNEPRAPPSAEPRPDGRRVHRVPFPCWPWSVAPTSASPPWSTASSGAARPSSRTSPGVTRDRVTYDANWNGRALHRRRHRRLGARRQGHRRADRRAGRDRHRRWPTRCCSSSTPRSGSPTTDEAVVRMLRKSEQARRPGGQQGRRPAHRGRGRRAVEPRTRRAVRRSPRCTAAASATCSTRSWTALPEAPRDRPTTQVGGPRRVAIVGRPNVGKSSLLNKAGAARSASSSTTSPAPRVDPVDELVEVDGKIWRFIDTAGIRTRVKEASGARVLRLACAPRRHRAGRGCRRGGRRQRSRSPSRTCGSSDRSRESGRALVHRLQQVGPDSTRSAATTSTARSSGTWCRCVGAPRSTSRRGPAGTSTGWCRRSSEALERLGDADLDRQAQRVPRPTWSPSTRTRCAAASSRGSCSAPRRTGPPTFVLFTTGSSTPATSASSSAGCARSSASPAPRSPCRCGRGRSGRGSSCDRSCGRWLSPVRCWPAEPRPSPTRFRSLHRGRSPGRPARCSRRTTGGTPTSPACRWTRAAPAGSRTCRRARGCTPTSGRRTATQPVPYGIPITVRLGDARQGLGALPATPRRATT